jgi:hypothetical protein
MQWIPKDLSAGSTGLSVKLTTHLTVMRRSRIRGTVPTLPPYVFIAWFEIKYRDRFINISVNVTSITDLGDKV